MSKRSTSLSDESATRFANGIRDALFRAADAERAAPMAAYMKNRFGFFGVPTPERRALLKPFLQASLPGKVEADWLIDVAQALWQYPERECQYAACDLLVRHECVLTEACEPMLAQLVATKSWWDSVDTLANRVYGPLLQRFPRLVKRVNAYATVDDMWLRRVAILYPVHYGAGTDTRALAKTLDLNLDHPDFFIRKAMGWILRQYARTNAEWVQDYLASRGDRVPSLTRREAAKHLG